MTKIDEWLKIAEKSIVEYCSHTELSGLNTRLNSNCEKEFSRGVSELVVSSYFAEKNREGLQIPRGTKKDKDIDVSFLLGQRQINVEVKCPDLSSDTSKEFTLHVPYVHKCFTEGKKIEREMVKKMGDNLNVIPNKILNFRDFLTDCSEKFSQSGKSGDLNIAVFSMSDLEWMDDYRIKIEDEKSLKEYDLIDVVVLTNAAFVHSRVKPENTCGYGLENCLNYILFNDAARLRMTLEEKQEVMSIIPNQTVESKAWYKQLVKDDDPIGIQVKSMQRLALYWKIALVSGGIISGDVHKKT